MPKIGPFLEPKRCKVQGKRGPVSGPHFWHLNRRLQYKSISKPESGPKNGYQIWSPKLGPHSGQKLAPGMDPWGWFRSPWGATKTAPNAKRPATNLPIANGPNPGGTCDNEQTYALSRRRPTRGRRGLLTTCLYVAVAHNKTMLTPTVGLMVLNF